VKIIKIIILIVSLIALLVLSWLFPQDMRVIGNIYAAAFGVYAVITVLLLPAVRRIDLWIRRSQYSNQSMLDHFHAIKTMQTIYVECPGCHQRIVVGGHKNSWDTQIEYRQVGEKKEKVCSSCGTIIRIQGNPWDEE
jgi:uncharacterized membrane protein YedE/YeeE